MAIVWFRRNLRLEDNRSLMEASKNASAVVPLFVFDPKDYATTRAFGLPRKSLRSASYLVESVKSLQEHLSLRGSRLIVRKEAPEDAISAIARAASATDLYFPAESGTEEAETAERVKAAVPHLRVHCDRASAPLVAPSALPFSGKDRPFPTTFTTFRKAIEGSRKRPTWEAPLPSPSLIPPLPHGANDMGERIPMPDELVAQPRGFAAELPAELFATPAPPPQAEAWIAKGGIDEAKAALERFVGGGSNARALQYKTTRNGMLGASYGSKMSLPLSLGCISPRHVASAIEELEKRQGASQETYWMLFELLWRDFFYHLSFETGNTIFLLNGARGEPPLTRSGPHPWRRNAKLFTAWAGGNTGEPLVDAAMRELRATGFTGNRARQIVASYLTKDAGMDWRLGAEWFESRLCDHDPASNYGNWQYVAGVGADPREDRYFNLAKQADNYDSDGSFRKFWCPSRRPKALHSLGKWSPAAGAAKGKGRAGGGSRRDRGRRNTPKP